jgi:hypothetical protein
VTAIGPPVGSFHPEGWNAAVRKLVITQNVTVDGSIEMLDDLVRLVRAGR